MVIAAYNGKLYGVGANPTTPTSYAEITGIIRREYMITQRQIDARDEYIRMLEHKLGTIETDILNAFRCIRNNETYAEAIANADREASALNNAPRNE